MGDMVGHTVGAAVGAMPPPASPRAPAPVSTDSPLFAPAVPNKVPPPSLVGTWGSEGLPWVRQPGGDNCGSQKARLLTWEITLNSRGSHFPVRALADGPPTPVGHAYL